MTKSVNEFLDVLHTISTNHTITDSLGDGYFFSWLSSNTFQFTYSTFIIENGTIYDSDNDAFLDVNSLAESLKHFFIEDGTDLFTLVMEG